MTRNQERIRDFLDDVCSQIKAREAHRDIRRELESHLEQLAAEREEAGADREEAVRYAVEQMGDPVQLGKELHRIHRPRTNWVILCGMVMFSVFGIVAMIAAEGGLRVAFPHRDYSLVWNKAISVCIGLLVAGFLYFFKPDRLRNYSWLFYITALGGMLLCHLWGAQINGSPSYFRIGPFVIDWVWVSTYLLILAAAGFLADRKQKPFFGLFTITVVVLVPILFLASLTRFPCIVLYAIALFAMTGALIRNWTRAALLTLPPFAGMIALRFLRSESVRDRLGAFWNPHQDPLGSSYMYVQIERAIQSAGWYGNGFAAPARYLPDIQSDIVYVYLIYSFGWLAGIGLAIGFAAFAGWLVRSALQIRDEYGKTLMCGIAATIGFQIAYNFLMSFGIVPLIGIPLPFVSHGFSHFVAEMAFLGLALAIYRRRLIAPSTASSD
ncbi:FtsW/RodA/SpoVE family cell cycle protein [Paenibacillus sp. GYB003]|uniref:FtsW/RodA/SpoVE family cell cycle protein n=1 Tax=Paenibacillus sp. GYB003 TaxID=2994392 RepID=UPI002F960D53